MRRALVLAAVSLPMAGCSVPRLAAPEGGAGVQAAARLEKEVTKVLRADYLLALPHGYRRDGAKKWPLILYLHGAGERGDDLARVKIHGPPKLIAAGKELPFVVVSPLCPSGQWWDTEVLLALLDDVVAKHAIDVDRVYLTGLSMGGFGTWKLASEAPDRFAAIAPICGGGSYGQAFRLADMPTWVFHGARDRVVPHEESERMVAALRRRGNREVKFTTYPEAGHDAWTATYANDELYEWFLMHRRSDREAGDRKPRQPR